MTETNSQTSNESTPLWGWKESAPALLGPDPRALYLDLMKRSLINWIYPEAERQGLAPQDKQERSLLKRGKRAFWRTLSKMGLERRRKTPPFDPERRQVGKDWPEFAHSMQGKLRLDNIQYCLETALADGIPGDFIEAGVWRGGGSILMRAILAAHGVTDRKIYVSDSFEGLPEPDADKYPADAGDRHFTWDALAISLETVQRNFDRYGLLDDQVVFLEGWFADTLPGLPVDQFAVIRVDGDMYSSTMDALDALYPRLAPGGFAIIDDYHCLENCRKAVDDYRAEHGIDEPMTQVDWTGAFWRKAGGPAGA